MRFVLASASPARLATLRRAGVEPEVIVSDVDESGVTADTTADLVRDLAGRKARSVAARHPDALVLGCDSLLDLGGEPLGKPGSDAAAMSRWRRLRGQTGSLWTGHCLIAPGGRERLDAAATVVTFADATDAELEIYCGTGEPAQVAGAFTIDGLGGWFVDAISGDPHNVVGLSLPLLRRMLAELGIALPELGYPCRSAPPTP